MGKEGKGEDKEEPQVGKRRQRHSCSVTLQRHKKVISEHGKTPNSGMEKEKEKKSEVDSANASGMQALRKRERNSEGATYPSVRNVQSVQYGGGRSPSYAGSRS